MRIKIYISIFLMCCLVIGTSIYYTNKSINILSKEKAEQIYNIRKNEYNVILKDKKNFLNSFAKFISSSNIVIKSYLDNNRTELINFVIPLYKHLHSSGLLEEIHFFKRPAISFVNFANLKAFNMDVSKARADIVWVSTSFSPSTHFYVCRLYPGLRATYPIVYKDRLLGSVSFGINIKIFKQLFKNLGVKDVSIYLNNEELKKSLLPNKYTFFKNLPSFKDWKVLGDIYNINLKPGLETKNGFVFTKIEIKDFFNKPMAYLVIKDDISSSLHMLKQRALNKMSLEVFSFLFIFAIIFMLFKWLFDKLNEMNQILYYIKTQQFEKIPEKTKEKDELDIYKNNLIDVAHDIKAYISLLTQKVKKYSNKAYKDGLTEIFNRRFLEEKAKELFLQYKVSKTQVGILMLDIDDFKKINDTYGHDIGDLVLIALADTIKQIIRKNDIFIRYGGEEFIIILPNSNIENTYKIAEKIRREIEKIKIDIGQKHLEFTISIGVSEIRDNDTSIFDAIKRADINLYKAKRNGKNRVEV
ncbi:sensor domain-containing diguanylate cyclase [Nautilia lithotrophica]